MAKPQDARNELRDQMAQRLVDPSPAPPRSTPFQPAAEVPEKPPIPNGAKPIASAPQDGSTVYLYNEQITHGVRGFWRRSRECVSGPAGSRWVVNNCWADPMTRKPLGAVIWTHWSPA